MELTAKDFQSAEEVRWCPGCGDYSILKQFTEVLASTGADPNRTVVVSGIGCSSRLPYYVDSYGIHSLHGRAPAVATGIKLANPDLDVWIITGDGDALSIWGNHLIHALRRNLNVPILLFNNEIYGLTKGQFSPTSKEGQVTKSTPRGSVDHPLNPLTLALGAGATWVARSMDRNPAHLRDQLAKSQAHQGSALLEIYQNCNVFHDGAFEVWTDKSTQALHSVFLEAGKPLVWGGTEPTHALAWNGGRPEIRELGSEFSLADAWVHDPSDRLKAFALAALEGPLRPFGVLYAAERPVFAASHQAGTRPLHDVLHSGRTWTVE